MAWVFYLDVGEPSISEILSAFSEFLVPKLLVILGQLDPSEATEIVTELSPQELGMHFVVETVKETSLLVEIIKSNSKNN